MLPTEPFNNLERQHFLQLDAAVNADDTLYVGEHKLALGENGVTDIEIKLVKIRWAGCTRHQVGSEQAAPGSRSAAGMRAGSRARSGACRR